MPKLSISTCIIWFLFCAIAFSNVGFNLFGFYFAVLFGFIWMLVCLIRLSLYGLKKSKNPTIQIHRSMRYWATEPLVLILTVALAWSGVFDWLRFIASLPALNQYARQVRAGQVDMAFEFKHPARAVGLYQVTMTELLADGTVRIITSSHSLLDEAGFVNSTNNPPPRVGEDIYRPLYDHWWYWQQSW